MFHGHYIQLYDRSIWFVWKQFKNVWSETFIKRWVTVRDFHVVHQRFDHKKWVFGLDLDWKPNIYPNPRNTKSDFFGGFLKFSWIELTFLRKLKKNQFNWILNLKIKKKSDFRFCGFLRFMDIWVSHPNDQQSKSFLQFSSKH